MKWPELQNGRPISEMSSTVMECTLLKVRVGCWTKLCYTSAASFGFLPNFVSRESDSDFTSCFSYPL